MRDIPVLKLNLKEPEKFGNVAAKLDRDQRRRLAEDLIALIKIDDTSMSEWRTKAEGYLNEIEADSDDRAPQNREQQGSGETAPPSTELTLGAVIQFSARATDALLGEPDLAKASEPGAEPLAAWVSSQLRTVDPNWLIDTDPLIVHMSVTGLAWRKRDFDEEDKVFHTHFRPSAGGEDYVIVNMNVRSIERAPRVTDQFSRYPYEIDRSIERTHWVDYEPVYDETDPQKPKRFYECDAWLDLDGDDIEEPWTFVIARDDYPEVVKIKPRWTNKTVVDSDEVLFFNPIRRFYPYRFLPDPAGGFFPMGFGKLLHRIQGSADRMLSSITDTAETESENGGVLAGGGTGLPSSLLEVKTNRVTTINTDGRPLGDMFQPFPQKSVSSGSVAVLEKMMTLGDRLAGTLNMLENAPASMTATMAKGLIDNGSQVQSAVHRRLVSEMTQEMREFVRMADAYGALGKDMTASDGSAVAVTADPQLATEMHRSALIGFHLEMVKEFGPFGAVDPRKVAAEVYRIARVANGQQFILPPQPPQATPKEKMEGMVALMKQRTENIKVTGAVAVQLTQALLNMVEAAGGMQNNQAALLTMAQLEHAVQQMMAEAGNAGNDLSGMAQPPGDGGAGALPPPTQDGGGSDIPGGRTGGPSTAGTGGGIS